MADLSPKKQTTSQPFQKKEILQLKPHEEDEPQGEEDEESIQKPGDPPGIPQFTQPSTSMGRTVASQSA